MELSSENLTRSGRVTAELLRHIATCKIGDRLPPERDLCQQLNVSRPTLRKALRGLRRQEIVEIIHGSGTFIRRQPPLEGEARPRSLMIGLSVPTLEAPAIARVAEGAERQAAEAGARLVLVHDQGDPQVQARDIQKLLEEDVDGLLIFLDRDNVVRPEYVNLLQDICRRNKPVVLLDRYVAGVELPCVLTDTIRGMYQATEHLIMAGRRRFAVLSWGPEADVAERNRFTGLQNALRDYDLSPQPVLHAPLGYKESNEVTARRAVSQWISQFGRPLPFDAIICFIDEMAYGAFQALRQHGFSVPDDVALVGFDNTNLEAYRALGLELTSVDQPFADMGRVGVQLAIARLRGEEPRTAAQHTLLPPRLIIRSSCGSAAGAAPALQVKQVVQVSS